MKKTKLNYTNFIALVEERYFTGILKRKLIMTMKKR